MNNNTVAECVNAIYERLLCQSFVHERYTDALRDAVASDLESESELYSIDQVADLISRTQDWIVNDLKHKKTTDDIIHLKYILSELGIALQAIRSS